ncbi:MAG: HTH domain-containing protein [bacterium]|nr:HTH domain-containing protein [Myxococcales bacterium]
MHPTARHARLIRILCACGQSDAAALAARLGVAPRTIYRDAPRLARAGLPVTGTRGRGYRYDDQQPVAAIDLSLPEALALIDALVAEAPLLPAERRLRDALAARLAARLPRRVRVAFDLPAGPAR